MSTSSIASSFMHDYAHPRLSVRENQVAWLISAGLSTKEIAHRLAISPHTARHHTERIFARLGVRTRAGVAAIVSAAAAVSCFATHINQQA